jgi:outer membrane protein OmpA-like peptidoglycan-associated protein
MADLNVEPKKKTSFLPWLLLLLGILAAVYFVSRDKDNDDDTATAADSTATSSGPIASDATTANTTRDAWGDVDLQSPSQNYDEVSNKDINVRGTNDYAVYELGEDVLFAQGKSEIRSGAVANLKQVAASIKKRFDNGQVRLYGFTDSQGDQQSNMQLSEARAQAVRKWLVSEGGIAESRISLNAKGESDPKESNATEEGRKENRRVHIVARKAD